MEDAGSRRSCRSGSPSMRCLQEQPASLREDAGAISRASNRIFPSSLPPPPPPHSARELLPTDARAPPLLVPYQNDDMLAVVLPNFHRRETSAEASQATTEPVAGAPRRAGKAERTRGGATLQPPAAVQRVAGQQQH
eukprot:scaffold945_cov403-Prasinococcus_capsulatus_cf.AAC.1